MEFTADSSEDEYESGDEQNHDFTKNWMGTGPPSSDGPDEPEYEFETMRDYESDTDEYLNPNFGRKIPEQDTNQTEVIITL